MHVFFLLTNIFCLQQMNILDIILAIPMAYLLYKGYRRGLVFELSSLLGLILGCWAAVHFSQYVSELLGLEGDGAVLMAFFITFVVVLLISILLGKCIKGLFKALKVGFFDKLAGALLGFLKAICVLGIVLSYVVLIDQHEIVMKSSVKEESVFFKPVYKVGNKLTESLNTYVVQRRYERAMEQQQELKKDIIVKKNKCKDTGSKPTKGASNTKSKNTKN